MLLYKANFMSNVFPLALVRHLTFTPSLLLPGQHLMRWCRVNFLVSSSFKTELSLIYNAVLVWGVQQSNSVIHTHISFFFQILFSYRLLQNIESISLCCEVGPCWLSVLETGAQDALHYHTHWLSHLLPGIFLPQDLVSCTMLEKSCSSLTVKTQLLGVKNICKL